jgi:hypothetical protein
LNEPRAADGFCSKKHLLTMDSKEKQPGQSKNAKIRHYNTKSKSLRLLLNNLHNSHGQKNQIIPDFEKLGLSFQFVGFKKPTGWAVLE